MLRYRPEVDGLRAVAMLSVLLCHAGAILPGGFVGVDVFFVISGYVITRAIASELDRDGFSLTGFYERRIRRIAPALVTVILLTAIASAFVLLPIDLMAMGKSAMAAALMVSNMLFWSESGYFDAAAQTKPLLHTWSLGIEEQFYLIYPILLAALWRRSRRLVLPALVALSVLSLGLAIWRAPEQPTDAFYLAPFRFWELLVGGLIALRPVRRLDGSGFAIAGLAMIGAAIAFYGEATPFPGAAALPPVIGAALVINGARDRMAAARLLAWRPLVFVGKISYSLYLIHWPLIVLLEYQQDARLSPAQAWLVIVVSIGLAALFWRFVEQPFRRKGEAALPPRAVVRGAAAGAALCCAAGGVYALSGGLPQRLPPDVRAVYAAIPLEWKDQGSCFIDTRGRSSLTFDDIRAGRLCSLSKQASLQRPDFLVWGDSHAVSMAPAIFKSGDEARHRGLFVGAGGCAPLIGFETRGARPDANERCRQVNEATIDMLSREKIPFVFLVARWPRAATGHERGEEGMFFDPSQTPAATPGEDVKFAAALDRTLARLSALGVRPVIVLDVPEAGYHVPYALAKAMMAGRKVDLSPSLETFEKRNGEAEAIIRQAAARRGADVIEPADWFCDDKRCDVVRDGAPLYRDADHITKKTALALSPIFDPIMARRTMQESAELSTR